MSPLQHARTLMPSRAPFDTGLAGPLSAGLSNALRAPEPQAGLAQDEGKDAAPTAALRVIP